MRNFSFSLRFSVLLCALIPLPVLAQFNVTPPTQESRGVGGAAPQGGSGSPVVAQNGPLFVFRSDAPNLVPDDTNLQSDIFQVDQTTGVVTRISVATGGIQADGNSRAPTLSTILPDGLYGVAFTSTSTNLDLSPNPDATQHVYVRLPTLGTTTLISRKVDGTRGVGTSGAPSITAIAAPDRIVFAYESQANNLIDGDNNSFNDIIHGVAMVTVGGLSVTSTNIVTRAPIGSQSNGDSFEPQVSGDGRFIVFSSEATNLVPGLTPTTPRQIYLHTIATGETVLISKDSSGNPGQGVSLTPRISFQGNMIVYLTEAPNIASGAGALKRAVMLYDGKTGTTRQINTSFEGVASNGTATDPSINANGRFATFSDSGTNLLSGDSNGVPDVFIKDLRTNVVARASVTGTSAEPDDRSDITTIGASGFNSTAATVGFRSFATNLVTDGSGVAGNVFSGTIGLPLPTIARRERIEAPADVLVTRRRAKITVQQFSEVTSGAQAEASTSPATAAAKRVKYDIRVTKTGKKRQRFNRISRRNTVTLRKLPKGTYNVKYRAVVQNNNGRIVSASAFSPRQRVTVP